MRLTVFILDNMEAIVAEWQTFAATLLPAAAAMTALELRNDAREILKAVAEDLATLQTRNEQAEKSKGRAPVVANAPETAAQTHAVLRARSGFDINQLVAEYRALRASVLRLWIDANPLDEPGVDDIVRFNEAIDQAIVVSVEHYSAQVERGRNLFLGMLGHDMRTPLNSILITASYLKTLNSGEQVSAAAERLIRGGSSMRALLDDLVDFNRTQLNFGIHILPSDIDLAAKLADELEQLRSAHPNLRIELKTTGDNRGRWDGGRLQQLLRNLVTNAIEHGYPDTPVWVTLAGEEADVRLKVTNSGPTIDPSVRIQMFEPLQRGLALSGRHGAAGANLGLGLFIVREIARAHGGAVEVHSEGDEITFTVHLPRQEGGASR